MIPIRTLLLFFLFVLIFVFTPFTTYAQDGASSIWFRSLDNCKLAGGKPIVMPVGVVGIMLKNTFRPHFYTNVRCFCGIIPHLPFKTQNCQTDKLISLVIVTIVIGSSFIILRKIRRKRKG